MIYHIHDWNTANDTEREKIGNMIAKYHKTQFNKNNWNPDKNVLHRYTVYIQSDEEPDTLVAYGTGTVYKTGDEPNNMHRMGQWNFRENCMRGLWIDAMYSSVTGCGTVILAELERLLQTHIDLVPRKNIYCNAVDTAAGFYRAKGYTTIKTRSLNPTDNDLDWKNVEVDCVSEWWHKGYCWLAKTCIGNTLDQEMPYEYNLENPCELAQAFAKQELDLLEQVLVFPKSFCQEEYNKLVERQIKNQQHHVITIPKLKLGRPTPDFVWWYLISHCELNDSGVLISFDKSIIKKPLLQKIGNNIEEYMCDILERSFQN